MNGYSPTTEYFDDSRKWGFLIVGASIVGVAACIQFAYAGLHEQTLARLPAALARSYQVAGKYIVTVPLAALGVLLIAGNLLANRHSTGDARPSPPPIPRTTPSRAAFHLPPPLPNDPLPRREEMEVGEPIPEEEAQAEQGAQTESDRLKIPALPGRFDGRLASPSSRTVETDSTQERKKGSHATVELTSAKYLNRRPRSGRGSHQGA